MRKFLLGVIASAIVSGSALAADAVKPNNTGAYDLALKCFVAHGTNAGSYEKSGNKTKAAASEKQARASFDAVVRLGTQLGYNNARVDQDFGIAQAKELPRLQTDRRYFAELLGICAQVGL